METNLLLCQAPDSPAGPHPDDLLLSSLLQNSDSLVTIADSLGISVLDIGDRLATRLVVRVLSTINQVSALREQTVAAEARTAALHTLSRLARCSSNDRVAYQAAAAILRSSTKAPVSTPSEPPAAPQVGPSHELAVGVPVEVAPSQAAEAPSPPSSVTSPPTHSGPVAPCLRRFVAPRSNLPADRSPNPASSLPVPPLLRRFRLHPPRPPPTHSGLVAPCLRRFRPQAPRPPPPAPSLRASVASSLPVPISPPTPSGSVAPCLRRFVASGLKLPAHPLRLRRSVASCLRRFPHHTSLVWGEHPAARILFGTANPAHPRRTPSQPLTYQVPAHLARCSIGFSALRPRRSGWLGTAESRLFLSAATPALRPLTRPRSSG